MLTLICPVIAISIHALLAESDPSSTVIVILRKNFYPRSPCGERLVHALKLANSMLFLSTLSLRRATILVNTFLAIFEFLSTLSLRRATSLLTLCPFLLCRFLSTLSLRRATGIGLVFLWWGVRFLSTLSLRRATRRPIFFRQAE